MTKDTTSNAVERALSMLELVSESADGLTNSDISRRLKIPKSSASYILRVLEKRGYLHRGEANRYKLGLKLMGMAGGRATHIDVREAAKPFLERFVEKSRLPEAHLAVLDNGRAVYIEKVESENSFIKMDIWVGHRLPVHTTAIGKVLVAELPEDEVVKILKLRGMEKKTKNSIGDPRKFLRELERVKKYGFALDDEENSLNVRCIAAPVYNAGGETIAALGASTIVQQLDDANLAKVVDLVKDAARKVSQQMGYVAKRV